MPALERGALAVDVGIIDMVGADQIKAGVQVFGTQSVCMQQPLANGIEHGKIIHKRFLQTAFRLPESGGREKGAIIAETARPSAGRQSGRCAKTAFRLPEKQ